MSKNILSKLFTLLSFALVSINGFAQTPFPYETEVVLAKKGSNKAVPTYTLYTTKNQLDPTAFVPGVSITFPVDDTTNVNGIGLNPSDRLLYAAAYSDPGTPNVTTDDVSLYRIGADGKYINLGLLPVTGNGAPVPVIGGIAEFVNFSAGTVTSVGSYLYTTIALTESGVTKFGNARVFGTPLNLAREDVRLFVATIDNISNLGSNPGASLAAAPSSSYEVTSTDPKIETGIDAFVEDINKNYPNGDWSNGGIQDIDIDPTSGKMYAYLNYQDPNPSGKSVDVVGFPIIFSAPSGGQATITSVGNTINETPDQEVAGVAFDETGSFFALFTSGQYGKLNLTTGAVEDLAVSSVPTIVYLEQNHLRGDYARAIPIPDDVLPVNFNNVEAKISGNQLFVTWSTASESNNDHFNVEVSKDGKNFSKIGTVISKAQDGNSSTILEYSFNGNAGAGLLGMSILGLGLGMIGFSRRQRMIASLVIMIGLVVSISACTKQDAGVNQNENTFVRITQVDKDGNSKASKIVKAINQ